MRLFYFIYGVFCFVMWSISAWFVTAFAFGMVGWINEVCIDELEDEALEEEIDKVIEDING